MIDLATDAKQVVRRLIDDVINAVLGPWRGRTPTGRRFERVNEVYF